MLEAPGERARAVDGDRLPPRIQAGAGGVVGPCQRLVAAGQGEAAFVGGLEVPRVALGQCDHGVADGAHMVHIVLVGAVIDEQCEVDAHLGGGEPHAVRGCHGGEHVAHQRAEFFIEGCHRAGLRMHHRFTPAGDRQHGATGGQLLDTHACPHPRSTPAILWAAARQPCAEARGG